MSWGSTNQKGLVVGASMMAKCQDELDDAALKRIEAVHAKGMTSAEILELFARYNIALSEATLRKYIQRGLLSRSVRVGRKGKHRGSQGVYPVSVVRQIVRIKEMMAQDYTIEEIQKEFLFRGDLEQLQSLLDSVFEKFDQVMVERSAELGSISLERRALDDARGLGASLLEQLFHLETRATLPVKRAAALELPQVVAS